MGIVARDRWGENLGFPAPEDRMSISSTQGRAVTSVPLREGGLPLPTSAMLSLPPPECPVPCGQPAGKLMSLPEGPMGKFSVNIESLFYDYWKENETSNTIATKKCLGPGNPIHQNYFSSFLSLPAYVLHW